MLIRLKNIRIQRSYSRRTKITGNSCLINTAYSPGPERVIDEKNLLKKPDMKSTPLVEQVWLTNRYTTGFLSCIHTVYQKKWCKNTSVFFQNIKKTFFYVFV